MRILVFFSLLLSVNGWGQDNFFKLYSGNSFDRGESVVQLADSSYMICGSSSSWGETGQVFLAHYSKTGTYLWSNNYGGPESEEGKKLLRNAAGEYYVAGLSNSFGEGDFDGYLLKLDANGNQLWEKTYGDAQHWEKLNSAIFTSDGGLILIGEILAMDGGDIDWYMTKVDADGNVVWTATYGTSGKDIPRSIIAMNGNYLIGGEVFMMQDQVTKGMVMEIDENGNILREDVISDLAGAYGVLDLCVGNNSYYVVGYRQISASDMDGYMGIYQPDGTLINHFTSTSTANSEMYDRISYNSESNKLALGYLIKNSGTYQDTFDVAVAYFHPTELYWINQFVAINNEGLDKVNQILPTNDGGFISIGSSENVGSSQFSSNGGNHVFLLKSAADGTFPATNGVTLNQLVEIDELGQEVNFEFYPNPANDKLFLKSELPADLQVNLYQVEGHLVDTFSVKELTDGISVNDWKSGVYLLAVNGINVRVIKL